MGRRKIMFAGVALVVLVGIGIYMVATPREPEYQGRKLSEWVEQTCMFTGNQLIEDPVALEAIRQIGPESIPFLLEGLKYEQAKPKSVFRTLLQRFVPQIGKPHNDQWNYADKVTWGFKALSTNANGAVPALATFLNNSGLTLSGARAAISLVYIGPAGFPVLHAALTNSNPTVRAAAIRGVGYLGSNAPSFLPELVRAINDAAPEVRLAAVFALGKLQLQLEPAQVVPALISAPFIQETQRANVNFGTNALPYLEKELNNPDVVVRTGVTNLIAQIKIAHP
jgi:hypothetical protein